MVPLVDGPATQRERRVFYLLLVAAAVLLFTLLFRITYQRPIELSGSTGSLETASSSADVGVPSDRFGFDPVFDPEQQAESNGGDQTGPPPIMLLAYVTGAVNRPGVYSFQQGDRWIDAIEAADGANGEADLRFINLAKPIQDGERIYVPREGEADPIPADGQGGSVADLRIDPNHATAELLQALPGVGPVLADRIIKERARGPFRSLDDLLRVSGIGTKTLERLAPFISLPR